MNGLSTVIDLVPCTELDEEEHVPDQLVLLPIEGDAHVGWVDFDAQNLGRYCL